jgi:hypothetical protein
MHRRFTHTLGTYFDRFQPKLLVEGNNVFNHSNVTTINTNATVNAAGAITVQPTYLPTSTTLEARILQFGLKIDF